MGLHVVAVDVTDDKLALARTLGADIVVNGRTASAVADVLEQTGGGAHGVLVTAVSVPAFGQALQMFRRKGTVSLVGLPPGDFPTPSSTSSSSGLRSEGPRRHASRPR
jgi:propanol-preferring alcohol dehydrogenase